MTINSIDAGDIVAFQTDMQEGKPVWNDYQRIATKSAIYPGQGTPLGLIYAALKSAGEAGEFVLHVCEAIKTDGLLPDFSVIRDKLSGIETEAGRGKIAAAEISLARTAIGIVTSPTIGQLSNARRELLIKEIGDRLWYLSAMCNEIGTTLQEIADMGPAHVLYSYPGKGAPHGLIYAAMMIAGHTGEIAELVGKAMRDDGFCTDAMLRGYEGKLSEGRTYQIDLGGLTPERRGAIIGAMESVFSWLECAAVECGTTLASAAYVNLRKLRDRQTRGALQGSGDNR